MYQVVTQHDYLPEVQTKTQNQNPTKPMTSGLEEIPIAEIPTFDDLDLSQCFGERFGFCEKNK